MFKRIFVISQRIFCNASTTVPELMIDKFIVYLQSKKLIFRRKKKEGMM